MNVTITLSPTDATNFADTFTQARTLADHPQSLFHEATTSWVENAADDDTLTYGTCFWFKDAVGAVLAQKVFEAAGETSFWLNNVSDSDSALHAYPKHAVLTSWDVWQIAEEFTPEHGYRPMVDPAIGDAVEHWLNSPER